MAEYDAVLLDLDGTLCEYVRGKSALLADAFETVGVDPMFTATDYADRVDGYADRAETMVERRRLCFADLAAENGYDRAAGRAAADAYADARDHSNVAFLDGAKEALDHLHGRYPLGLVTNGDPTMQDQKIDGLGIREYFETVVYAGYDVAAKPDPEPFEVALGEMALDDAAVPYVGNNYETDIVGAAGVGLDGYLVGTPPAEGPVEPTASVETPGELTTLF